jgi:hypothetical protein
MHWNRWRRHFEAQATRPLPYLGQPAGSETNPTTEAIAASLAKFQLGEAGEGRIAHEIDRASLPTVDADYRRALKLFVAEEGRHARLLALAVLALGGRLVHRNWTEALFVRGRRTLGIRLKIVVLLAAEILGLTFYGLIARALPRGPLRATLRQIRRDELFHLRFHADFLRSQSQGLGWGTLLRIALWAVCLAASLVVILDHLATLRAVRLSPATVLGRMVRLTAFADRRAYALVLSSSGDARAMPSRRLSSRAAWRETSTRSPLRISA